LPNVDLTQWPTVWGRIQANHVPSAWPIERGATPQWTLPRDRFTCTKFRTTAVTVLNQLSMASYYTGGNLSVSIAPTCGDFTGTWSGYGLTMTAPHTAYAIGGQACKRDGIGAFQSSFMIYRVGLSTNYFCGLAANADYFVNMKWTNNAPTEPNPSRPLCNALGCKVAVTSNTGVQ
jgi:hypothetical protein